MNAFTAWVRRAIHGPDDAEINRRVLAEGGPGYPIPPVGTALPTSLVNSADPILTTAASATARRHAAEIIAAARVIGEAAAARHEQGDLMSDTPTYTREGDEGRLDPVTDSGVHAMPDDEDGRPTISTTCPACGGKGRAVRLVNDLLRESVNLIPVDGGDMVIKEFYTRLLRAAPDLAPLFPRDLLTAATQDGASPGAMQRDKLLQALVALSETYGGSTDDMDRLDTALATFGRSHAAFARPDGGIRGATVAEYLAVKDVLFGTLMDVAGDAWRPEYTAAWSEAYDYAMIIMLYAQVTSGMRAARYPRRDADR